MDCEKIKELLSRYIDDQLEKDDRALVEEHLKSCAQCTEHYEKLLALGRMVDDFDVEGDESYWMEQKDAVLDQIEKLGDEKIVPVRRNYRSLVYKLAAVAASVALLAFISIHELEKVHPNSGIFKKEQSSEMPRTAPVMYSPQPVGKMDTASGEKNKLSEKYKDHNVDIQSPIINESYEAIPDKANIEESDKGEQKAVEIPSPKPDEVVTEEYESQAPPITKDDLLRLGPAPAIVTSTSTPQVSDKKAAAVADKNAVDRTIAGGEVSMQTNAEKTRAALAEQTDLAGKVLPDIAPAESTIAIQQLPVDSAKAKGPSTDAYMAMYDVERQITQLSDRGIEPDQFENLSARDIATYINYYDKANDLRQEYSSVISFYAAKNSSEVNRVLTVSTPARKEAAETPPADSMKIIIQKMANAFHNLGRVTPINYEKGQMLDYLRSLRNLADSGTQKEIDRYIGDIESETK